MGNKSTLLPFQSSPQYPFIFSYTGIYHLHGHSSSYYTTHALCHYTVIQFHHPPCIPRNDLTPFGEWRNFEIAKSEWWRSRKEWNHGLDEDEILQQQVHRHLPWRAAKLVHHCTVSSSAIPYQRKDWISLPIWINWNSTSSAKRHIQPNLSSSQVQERLTVETGYSDQLTFPSWHDGPTPPPPGTDWY